MDANDVVLFAHLIDAGSFAQAAQRTGLPKSTLSRRISALETELGERLLTRSTRRLVITDFGEQVLAHAQRLRDELDALSAMVAQRQKSPMGLLRVSMPPDFRELDLTPMLLQFTATCPDVRLELDLSPRRVDLVAERFDLAIRAANCLPDDSTLVARKLCVLRTGLYASPAYLKQYGMPQHPDELAKHYGLPLIDANGTPSPWRLTRGNEYWEGVPNGPLAANSPGLERDLAAHGLGIVALDDRLAAARVADGSLVPVLEPWQLPSVTLWCITPGRRLLPPRTQAFITILKETLLRGGPAPQPLPNAFAQPAP